MKDIPHIVLPGSALKGESGAAPEGEAQRRVHDRSRSPCVDADTIHYLELPEAKAGSPLRDEWNYYRREAARLLDEGHEGRFALIKGEQIIGIWDTHDQAQAVALQKYLMQPCLIQQVRTREPVVRLSPRFWGCQP